MRATKMFFLLTIFLLGKGFVHKINAQVNGLWSGTISEHSQVTGNPNIQAESRVSISYNNNVGTGTYTQTDILTVEGKMLGKTNCSGTDTVRFAELSIDNAEKTYTIQTSALIYTCTYLDGSSDSGEVYITVAYEPWDENPRVLKGSKTLETDIAGGKLITTTTWYLVKGSEVELIVTPQDYDIWLPIPGTDEQTPGPKMMNVTLELKDRNGRPASEKAKVFKLSLSNTSKEKGITINKPLVPAAQQPPDLRFQPQQGAVIKQEGQLMIIYCPAGCLTANFNIACYDGGAWTTLTAVAVLETDSIKGNLLEPGGEENILIPKRKPGTKIASAWLTQNGNPGETDDEEKNAPNPNIGDGLTAYEEYRGVIANEQFKRLDPQKKELGVWQKKGPDRLFFADGLNWFENATGITIIRFYENDIGADRRLNKNFLTAHSYDQYVLKLIKKHVRVNVLGRAEPGPGIPKAVTRVNIDYDQIVQKQRELEREGIAQGVVIPFSLEEMVAKTVAHELGHGVNINHHGNDELLTIDKKFNPGDPVRIFSHRGTREVEKPYHAIGVVGKAGNQQSGDIFCIMNYNPCFDYSLIENNNSFTFYIVPLIPLGSSFCTDADGTDINALPFYFGDARTGNCFNQIKLKD